MTVKIFVGDCRQVLRTMEPESVHTCVTSPPYWGLRDYGIAPSVWGGDDTCKHRWGNAIVDRSRATPGVTGSGLTNGGASQAIAIRFEARSNFCTHCGAWRGSFGLEPSFPLYVEHAVEIFREVRRVLRPDAILWLNLGDSYISGGGAGEQGSGERVGRKHTQISLGVNRAAGHTEVSDGKNPRAGIPALGPNRSPQNGLKAKNLVGIPWRIAFALQDDGWYLRQDIIWAKPNPMPESVTDRCTKSHEYLFMLTKNERYYFDQDAILEPISANTHLRVSQATLEEQLGSEKVPGKTNGPMKAVVRGGKTAEHGTGVKNNDSFQSSCSVLPGRLRKTAPTGEGIKNNESMDAALVAPGRRSGNKERKPASARGVPIDTGGRTSGAVAGSVPWEGFERNKRSVWTVTTVPFGGEFCRGCQSYYEGDGLRALRVETIDYGDRKEKRRHCRCGSWDKWLSHFATFPPTLIEPCIEASTSEYGCCVTCGSPYRRVIERGNPSKYAADPENTLGWANTHSKTSNPQSSASLHRNEGGVYRSAESKGWEPGCDCPVQTANGRLARGIVLDLFGGAGTTGMASDRLRRDAVLIEINPEYAEMARQRLALDAGPMFGDIQIIAPVHEATE